MKNRTFLFLLLALAAVSSGHTQMGGAGPAPSGSASNDDMTSISGIRRPTTSTPAPTTVSRPAKPLQASLSADEKGTSAAATFPASTPKIYLQWKEESATKDEKLRVVWVVEDAGAKFAKNKKLTENTQTLPGPGVFGSFYLPAAGKLPPGKYRADVYEGTKLAKSLKFAVTK